MNNKIKLSILIIALFIFSTNTISKYQNLNYNQKNSNEKIEIQYEKFINDTQDSFKNLLNIITSIEKNINSRINELENKIQDNSNEIAKITGITNKQINYLSSSDKTLNKELKNLKKNYENIQSSLNKYSEDINNKFELLDKNSIHLENAIKELNSSNSKEIITIKKDLFSKFLITGSAVLISILLTLVSAIYFKRKSKKSNLLEESVKLDTKLSKILKNQLELIKKELERKPPSTDEEKHDHSIPITVGSEVFRMRKRLKHMDKNTKGLHALKNALDRLEFELNQNGYYIKDLSGKLYYDEMTVKIINSITKNNIEPGKPVISRMISPQIFYKDKAVSLGEVELAISPQDKK